MIGIGNKMILRKQTVIEVGSQVWNIWLIDRKSQIIDRSQLVVPSDTLWHPEAMAQLICDLYIKGRLFFLINSQQTITRIKSAVISDVGLSDVGLSDVRRTFGMNYTYGEVDVKGATWVTAIPSEIPNSIVEMCRIRGIHSNRICTIDTLEYRMSCHISDFKLNHYNIEQEKPCWLLIPQASGIRLVHMEDGAPAGCFYLSNDPDFRIHELERIFNHLGKPPKSVYIMNSMRKSPGRAAATDGTDFELNHSSHEDYLWLRHILQERSVHVIDENVCRKIKEDMLENWVRTY